MKVLATLCLCGISTFCVAQSNYTSTQFGISFQYPKGYDLKQGDLGDVEGDDWRLGYLGPIPMEFVAPGGVRVVTVKTADDAYPETDFGMAFFTVSLNRYLTPEECKQFSDDISGSMKPVKKKIGGIVFNGLDQGEAAMMHQFGGTYYHGFSAGWCYEIGVGITTAGYGAVDGLKKVDTSRVEAALDRILRTVNIRVPKTGRSQAASPSINSFALTPAVLTSPTGSYRFSWDVQGAAPGEVSLSASCSGDLDIFEITDEGQKGSVFPCNAIQTMKVASGSLGLEFRNMSGEEMKVTVRLLALGSPSVSKVLTISLQPLPVLISIAGDGQRYIPDGTPVKPFRMAAGSHFLITGVALLQSETLWIGATSIPVVHDRQDMYFTSPTSLPPGQYPLFIANERGKSDVLTVELVK